MRFVFKSLAPGYRVGWVAGGRYAEQITRLKLMTTISPSGTSRHCRLSAAWRLRPPLAQAAPRTGDAAGRDARLRRAPFPGEYAGYAPFWGYFLWFEFPEQVDSLQLLQLALAQGISLAPGPIFGHPTLSQLRAAEPWPSMGHPQ